MSKSKRPKTTQERDAERRVEILQIFIQRGRHVHVTDPSRRKVGGYQ